MRCLRWIVFAEVAALFVGLPPAWSGSKSEAKAEDNFKVSWSSVTYSKTVDNTEASPGIQIPKTSETLSLNCEVEILDPNCVLGVCREPIIERIIGRWRQECGDWLCLAWLGRNEI